MESRLRRITRTGLTGILFIIGLMAGAYVSLSLLFPMAKPFLRTLFVATGGVMLSNCAMVLRVMWVSNHTPGDSSVTLRALPVGGTKVLGVGWLAVSLPLCWPYGRTTSIISVILGVAIIITCHVWANRLAVSTHGGENLHRAV